MKDLAKWEKRPIVYSFILTLGFIILLFLDYISSQLFLIGSLILYLVVIIELYYNSNQFHEKIRKNSKKVYEFSHHKSIQFSHHLLLPSLIYFSIVGFTYFNGHLGTFLVLIAIFFVLFSLLFENIYTYYHHNFSIHKSTSYIYDLLSIFTIYFFVDVFLNLYINEIFNDILVWILFTIVLFVICSLLVIRHSITTETTVSIFIFTAFASGIFRNISIGELSKIQASIVITSIYALYNLIINNYSERKFELEDILEFGVILLLALSVLNIFGF